MSALLRGFDDAVMSAAVRVQGLVARERGQTLAEYSLMLTLIAVGVTIPTMLLFRGQLTAAFTAASNCLNGSC